MKPNLSLNTQPELVYLPGFQWEVGPLTEFDPHALLREINDDVSKAIGQALDFANTGSIGELTQPLQNSFMYVGTTLSSFGKDLELDEAKAPKSVANFLAYVKAGHYDNTVFHRVIKNFMIQGGGMEPGMNQKECQAPIENEAANGLKNKRGSIAMARTNDPHSATAQFFINVVDNDFLDFKAPSGQGWGYCVFGEVTEGMDVVDKIRAVATGNKGFHQDVPKEDVVIEKAEIV